MLKKLENKIRQYFPKHLHNASEYVKALKGLKGIEIGGPSQIFTGKGLLPVYATIKELDGCNFSNDTVWEGKLIEGNTYQYLKGKLPGHQFISAGDNLSGIKNNTYDFVLSCHNLEHFANPIKALYEWKRIVKQDGYLLLVLPNKEKTFDHNRPVTTIEHLLSDHKNNTPETDETHFEESLLLHDRTMDAGISSNEELRKRIYNNIENRCMHHHVFDANLVKILMKDTNFEIIAMDLLQIHIFVLAKNLK
ncbi:MAG: methyltransferase domain-containing protein [Ferruginibacter sp.]